MKKLLIATTNPGKLADMSLFLSDLAIELVSLKDQGITSTPEETGKTFKENAIIKAKYYCGLSGLATIADDAGAEIDHLGGLPGVSTRRWIHQNKDSTDEEIISYTIKKLKGVQVGKRGMQLRAIIALALPNGKVFTSEGKVRGRIATVPSEKRYPGFPFRSLMYLPQLKNKFYNHTDLTNDENQRFNHRMRALKKLKKIIYKYVLT